MANQIINSNNLTSKEIPELYVRYFNPKIKINTEITIPYYVSDNTQAEYLNNSNAKSFTTIVTCNSKIFSSTTTAGEFTINIGSISTVGETYFSIYTIDNNGVASVEQFFDILIIDGAYEITQDQTYTMTSSDLNTYSIKAGESVSINDAKTNGASLTNLFKGIKDKGYRKLIMLNNTYMIDYHGDKVTLPDQFTVDMNGATFKATQCTDVNVANILDLRDCFDSHVMNGKLIGNYKGFDFEATKTNTNYYIPGEGLAVAEINGARYSSFENMDMGYSVGYNLGVFGGKRSGYVGTPGKLAFKNQYYIDANGNQVSSSSMCTTDITDISVLSDRGEFQCSVYLGYGGLALNKAELFIHFYDSSQKYLKTTKTRQYQIVKIPPGAKYVRITGFTSVTESSGMTICHTGQATNCELINIKSHNTRTCAMHPGIYNHLLIKNCTFNKVADENEYKVTKLALDFEDGYENGRNLFFINNEVYDGTSALTIQKCFNCNVIKCRNFGLDLRGHIKGALIKNNFFNEGSIYTTNFDSQSHMKLDNNTFFRSLKFLKWDNNGNYPTVGLTKLDCKQNYQNNSNTNVIIDNAVEGSGSGGAPSQTYYNIINNMPNCTTNNSDNLVLKDSSYKATITPRSGYDITSITVTMGGVDITSTALSGHVINIPKVTGNVNINVITREIETYRITNNLTNCTNSNTASTILKNGKYSGTIVSNEGYNLYSIVVTMDEADITASSVSGNAINIPKVTGDVIITAVCTTEVSDVIYDNGALNKGTLNLKNATAESEFIRINQSQESYVTINDYKLTLNKNDKVYMDIGLDTSDPGSGYSIRIPQLGDSSVNNFTDTNMINESQIYNALNGKDKVTIYWTVANTVSNIDLTLTSYFARVKIFKIWIDKNSTESGGGGTTPETYYKITNNISHCINSNSTSSVLKDSSYKATITPKGGYDITSITVTMGGTDITSTALSGHVINIPKVTGNVVITAECSATEMSDNVIYDNGTMNKGTLKLTNATAESEFIRINQSQESYVTINDYKLTLNKNDKVYMDIGLDTSDPGSGYSIRIPQLGDSSVNNFTDTNMINESQIYNALNGKDKVTIYWTVANTVSNIDLTLTSYFARVKIFKIWIDKNSTESGGGGTTPETYYKITNNISHCINSNSASTILKDSSYKAVISPMGGYNITSITVTMGGVDITASSVSGNNINISKVTGDIIITAKCAATEMSDNVIYDNGTMNKGTLKLTNATAESTYIKINQSQDSSVMISGYPISLNKNDKVYMDIGLDTSDPLPGYSIRLLQLGDSSVNNFTDTNMINESQISTALNGKDKVTIYWTVANTVTNIDLTLSSYFARVKIFKIWIEKNSTEPGGGGETTPETLTISNISNITQPAQTEFYIEYSTNIAVAKHEVSWDGGNIFYNKTSDVVANGTSYKFKHDNSGAAGVYNMAIRVTTASGTTKTSNIFTVTLTGNATDEYSTSCTSDYILDKMYPMPQNHEALPSGVTDTWGTQSRWENQQRPTAAAHNCGQANCPGAVQFKALGAWSNVYRVKNTGFSSNTGVEMRNIKVYGWYNGQWEKVQDMAVPDGNFYAESFSGDSNQYFSDSIKTTSTSKTIILREANKINNENCMYHPFSNIKNFDVKYEYVYTCIDLRKVKWDENGVDDRDSSHYCSNCGGDWWLAEGLTFDSSWQHNKGICQPKMIEITNNWRRFSMTTVPQGWTNGFPQ